MSDRLEGESLETLRHTERVENAHLDAEADAMDRPHGDRSAASAQAGFKSLDGRSVDAGYRTDRLT